MFQCMHRADRGWTFTFCLVRFLKANYLVDVHSFFFFFFFPHVYQSLSLAQKRRIAIRPNERAAVPAKTAFSTGLVIVCLRENVRLSSERLCDGREVIVAEGERCTLPLCEFFFCCGSSAAGGLKRVPHESGSGTAALSGDKVIRTGNNERERKS